MGKKKRVVEVDEKSHGGCLKPILIFFLILIAISVFSSNKSNDDPAPRATNTVKAVKTAKPTKTPKPTATPEPDFSGMALEKAVAEIANYHCDDDFDCTNTFIIDGGVSIDVKVDTFLTQKTMVRDCCRLYMEIAKSLFTNKGAISLIINFDTPGRDKYGNEKLVRAMEIFINRETAEKINFDYMIDNLYSSTADFLNITDRYFVHNDLKNGVY